MSRLPGCYTTFHIEVLGLYEPVSTDTRARCIAPALSDDGQVEARGSKRSLKRRRFVAVPDATVTNEADDNVPARNAAGRIWQNSWPRFIKAMGLFRKTAIGLPPKVT